VDGCRVLAARATYYLGEPENNHGHVRGDITREEWTAFHELAREFGDASPPLKALARVLGEFDSDKPIIIKKHAFKNGNDQPRQDAEMVCSTEALEFLLNVLTYMVFYSALKKSPMPKDSEKALEELTGVSAKQMWKETLNNISSACKILKTLQEDLRKDDGRETASLLMSIPEARSVWCMLWVFRKTVYAGAEAPPEYAKNKEDTDHLLVCAERFFARIGGATEDALKNLK